MPQPGKSAIQLYYSTTAAAVPLAANLQPGELAINTADERLYFKNNAGAVKVLASSAAANLASPPAIGNVTPNTGAFTTLTATGNVSAGGNLSATGTITTNAIKEVGGNVGVGRTPGIVGLDVQTAGATIIRARSGAATGSGFFASLPNTDNTMFALADKVNTTGGTAGQVASLFTTGGVPLVFEVGASEKARIDTAGNLGLGVVPSAHDPAGFGGPSLQIGARGSLLGSAVYSTLANNVYYTTGSFRYRATDFASMIEQSAGGMRVLTAPSGTAGNPIPFTQTLAVGLGATLALEGATSAAGTGIAFPATQLPSTNPNTLDDYEEGTFTPSLTIGASATGITYSFREGRYTKTGRVYHFTAQIVLTSKGVNVGTAQVIGLPFTAGSATDDFFMARIVGATSQPGMCSAWLFGNTTSMTLCKPGTTGGPAIVTNTDLTNTTEILITGTVTT